MVSYLINQSLVELFDLTDCDATDKIRECMDLTVLKEILSKQGIFLDIDEGLWCKEVLLDERKMSQILRNLLGNALKYRKEKVQIKIYQERGSLFISVIDDGRGIPESFHENIFKCYFQMDQDGTHCVRGHGLGLAGVMVLIEDLGGELFLESDVGKGAKFSFRLPLDGY